MRKPWLLPVVMLCMAPADCGEVSDTSPLGGGGEDTAAGSPSLWDGDLPDCSDELTGVLSSDGKVVVGATAPDFTLESQSGPVRLWGYCEQIVVICSEPQWGRDWDETLVTMQSWLEDYGSSGLVPLLLVPETKGGDVPDAAMLQTLAEAGGATFPLLADPDWGVSFQYELDGIVSSCSLLGRDALVLSVDSGVTDRKIEEALSDL